MKEFLKRNRNPLDLAEKFDLPISKARKIIHEQDEEIMGWGPARKQRNIISRTLVGYAWPEFHRDRLEHYRMLHDQGRVTMCQGRDGKYIIQYAIPTKQRVTRDPYFRKYSQC